MREGETGYSARAMKQAALADGVDPLTGEAPDRDNVSNQPEITRALHTAAIFWFSIMSV